MNPTPQVMAWIRAQNPDWTQNDADIAAALNAVEVDNPTPAPRVLPVLSGMALFAMVSPESQTKLANYVNLPAILSEIRAGEREPTCNWIRVLAAAEIVTAEEATAAITYLNTPAPDPEHPAQVPAVQVQIGRLLDADDVAQARE